VLRVEKVGREDNFFELGGHSLVATQVMSRIREEMGVGLQLRAIFEQPTIAELAELIERANPSPEDLSARVIKHAPRDKDLPLSFAQQRLWFIDQLEPGAPIYNVHVPIRLIGALNVEALEKSLSEIVRRHEALRTTFPIKGERPVQMIAPAEPLALPVRDLSDASPEAKEAEIRKASAEEANHRFNLGKGPLLKIVLLRLDDQEHVLLFTLHHIICDGWTVGVFVNELVALYPAFCNNKPSPLAELQFQYADFAAWQADYLQGDVLENQINYWKRQLGDFVEPTELPLDWPRRQNQSYRGSRQRFEIPESLTEKIRALTEQEGVTMFMLLLAGFQALLHRYTSQEKIVVGSNVANRNRSDIENMIGIFVNNLVLQTDLSGNPSFRELLVRVREICLGAYANQDIPFERLVEELQPERKLNHTPLFQVMFNLHNMPASRLELPGLKLISLETQVATARFDLVMNLWDSPRSLTGSLEYNTDLFKETTIARLIRYYKALLQAVVSEPDACIEDVSLAPDDEAQTAIESFNEM